MMTGRTRWKTKKKKSKSSKTSQNPFSQCLNFLFNRRKRRTSAASFGQEIDNALTTGNQPHFLGPIPPEGRSVHTKSKLTVSPRDHAPAKGLPSSVSEEIRNFNKRALKKSPPTSQISDSRTSSVIPPRNKAPSPLLAERQKFEIPESTLHLLISDPLILDKTTSSSFPSPQLVLPKEPEEPLKLGPHLDETVSPEKESEIHFPPDEKEKPLKTEPHLGRTDSENHLSPPFLLPQEEPEKSLQPGPHLDKIDSENPSSLTLLLPSEEPKKSLQHGPHLKTDSDNPLSLPLFIPPEEPEKYLQPGPHLKTELDNPLSLLLFIPPEEQEKSLQPGPHLDKADSENLTSSPLLLPTEEPEKYLQPGPHLKTDSDNPLSLPLFIPPEEQEKSLQPGPHLDKTFSSEGEFEIILPPPLLLHPEESEQAINLGSHPAKTTTPEEDSEIVLHTHLLLPKVVAELEKHIEQELVKDLLIPERESMGGLSSKKPPPKPSPFSAPLPPQTLDTKNALSADNDSLESIDNPPIPLFPPPPRKIKKQETKTPDSFPDFAPPATLKPKTEMQESKKPLESLQFSPKSQEIPPPPPPLLPPPKSYTEENKNSLGLGSSQLPPPPLSPEPKSKIEETHKRSKINSVHVSTQTDRETMIPQSSSKRPQLPPPPRPPPVKQFSFPPPPNRRPTCINLYESLATAPSKSKPACDRTRHGSIPPTKIHKKKYPPTPPPPPTYRDGRKRI